MNIATIEDLAYLMQQAKKEDLPKPIIFLGAGASKTGGVPLANEIVVDILNKYKHNPKIKLLKDEEKTYPKLMECLTPFERNKLLKEYIEIAQINVTHLYIAQLIVNGYIDYVLTVNFDNLMLRALALFNDFPATYDMAILKDLTTTSFKEKSIVYLHGQYHGLWLLNTEEEMAKVDGVITPILNSIKNQRTWIFIGYSGEDPIFNHITKLGRFDNGLYWVAYNKDKPCEKVCNKLLDEQNTNAYIIEGFDSDSFMLNLNNKLNIEQPIIIDKPFTSLKIILDNIVDIDDKEHYRGVKERLEIAKDNVTNAINQYEIGDIDGSIDKEEFDINLMKKRIIDLIVKEKYEDEEFKSIESSMYKICNTEINNLVAAYLNGWGNAISEIAVQKNDENLYEQSFEKFRKATELNSKDEKAFYNWGTAIFDLAKLRNDENLYEQSFEKFRKATELNPKDEKAFYNWGNAIIGLTMLKNDENLYEQGFEKFRKATELNPNNYISFNNWGTAIFGLAKLRNDENLYEQSFEKFRKATELNPKGEKAFYNWGNAIFGLAKLRNDENLYEQSFEKFRKSTELNPKGEKAFYNWGTAIFDLAKLRNDENLFEQSIDVLNKCVELSGKSYNLACLFAYKNKKEKAFELLDENLKNKEITPDFVREDSDWKLFNDDIKFKKILNKYKK